MGTALTRDARPPGDRVGAAPTGPVETDDPVVTERARDDRLARRVRSGDDRAFEALYWRYQGPLSRYARSIVGSEADAQDVMQTAMTKALLALRADRRDAPMKAWLFRIVHNEAISLLRRRPPGTDRDPESIVELALGHGRGADVVAEERAALATLVADLNELGERQRAALVLRELSGLSHEEIAAALGISVGVARQTVLEARRSLMEFGQGREMSCEEIQTLVSAGDRRTLKARRVRGHLRDCQACTAFSGAIDARSRALSVLAPPLPIAAAALPLLEALGHTGASGGTATTGGSGAAGAAGGPGSGSGAGLASGSGSAALTTKAGLGAISAVKVAVGGAALIAAAGGSVAVLGHTGGRPHPAGRAPIVHGDLRRGDQPASGRPGAQRTPAAAAPGTHAGHSSERGASGAPGHLASTSDGHPHGAGPTHSSGRSARHGAGPPPHSGSTTHGRAGTGGRSMTGGGSGHHSGSGNAGRSGTHGTVGTHGRSGSAGASGRHGGTSTRGSSRSSRHGGTSTTTSSRHGGTSTTTSSRPTGAGHQTGSTSTAAPPTTGRGGASGSTGSSGSGSANATAGTAGTTTTGTATTGTAAGGGDTSGAGTANRGDGGTGVDRTTPSTATPSAADLGAASPAGGLPSGATAQAGTPRP